MPVVLTTRWPWMVTASAPPFHIALTTAWMSCWWTSRRFGLSGELAVVSCGASESVTVTPGPTIGLRPAGPFMASARRLTARTCLLPTELLSTAIWLFRSETLALRASTPAASYCTTEARSVKRPGRRSVPSLLWALTTNSAPLSRPTIGVATRHTKDRRGRGAASSAARVPGARRTQAA